MIPCNYVNEPYIAKTGVTGLPISEDVILHSVVNFVLTQYRRVMDRQIDAQTVRNAAAKTALSITTHCE